MGQAVTQPAVASASRCRSNFESCTAEVMRHPQSVLSSMTLPGFKGYTEQHAVHESIVLSIMLGTSFWLSGYLWETALPTRLAFVTRTRAVTA